MDVAFQLTTAPMTFNDLESHSPISSLSGGIFRTVV